jgi:hypothetical protein
MRSYADWLRKQGEPVYRAAGIEWRLYHSALVPVNDVPMPVEADRGELRRLLRQSGAWLTRYPGPAVDSPDPAWYYVVCDHVLPIECLAKKARYELRLGLKSCAVRRVTAEWLAGHGYECYRAAHGRYRNTRPSPEPVFVREMRDRAMEPFEFWGAFVGDVLAAYSSCIVTGKWVQHSAAKYHPGFLHARTAYVLVRALIEEYVGTRGLTLTNGTRSISHDTNYGHLLEKLGFVRRGCELKVVYRPALEALVNIAWPLRHAFSWLPDSGPAHGARVALVLEELRRAAAPTGCRA